MDGLTVSNTTGSLLKLESTGTGLGADSVIGDIQFYGNDASTPGAGIKAGIKVETVASLGDDAQMKFTTSDGTTNNVDRMLIANNGNISFYEDTGTTAKFFWDASAESLGIGTSSPSVALQVESNAAQSGRSLRLAYDGSYYTEIASKASGGVSYNAVNATAGGHKFEIDGTEAMRIDSSGNVGIGTSSPSEKLDVTGNIVASGSIIADNIGSGSLAPVSPSGTSVVNFTSIPAGVRQVTVMLEQLSLNNNDDLLIQLGDSGGIETSGYISRCVWSGGLESTLGMVIDSNAQTKWTGAMTFTRVHTTNRFVQTHTVVDPDQNEQRVGAGSKTLSGELTQLRVVPTGSNTFDNGSVSIAWSY